jgi:hypothetical protein
MTEAYRRHLAKLSKDPGHQRLCEENIRLLLKHAAYLGKLEQIEHLRAKFGLPKRAA